MREKAGVYYRTDEYERFRPLDGNRNVTHQRAQKIVKSIEKVGYLDAPILVNERYEVIDGQGRLEACKLLGIPVLYIMQNGLGINECVQMNIHQSNWKLTDYIHSYAVQRDVSYIYLENLMKAFPRLSLLAIVNAINGNSGSGCNATVQSGMFKCSEAEYMTAMDILSFESQFVDIIDAKRIGGRKELWFYALAFAFRHEGVDNERMAKQFYSQQFLITPVATTEQAVEILEQMYNAHIRKKVYLKADYQKYNDERLALRNKERRK